MTGGRFSLEGKVAVVTGGTGVLGGVMARGLAAAGARVAILGRSAEKAHTVATGITSEGGAAIATPADVLQQSDLEAVRQTLMQTWGRIDILVNAAGGNQAGATIPPGNTVFDVDQSAMRQVVDLNLMGTFLPTQVLAQSMSEQGGSIINISSMAADRTLTRVIGYSAAKAGVDNLTRWLAVEFGLKHRGGCACGRRLLRIQRSVGPPF